MYIKKVIIKNFRVFNEKGIEIVFSKGPNTIIGPNNSGKSAIIDALRIAFSACDYHKDIYFKLEDFHFNKMGIRANEAYIGLVLDEVDDTLMEIIDPEKERIGYINYKFYSEISKSGIERVKYKVWGGNVETNVLTTELFENNFFVSYLNALRDVDNEFKPSKIIFVISANYDYENDKMILSNIEIDEKSFDYDIGDSTEIEEGYLEDPDAEYADALENYYNH